MCGASEIATQNAATLAPNPSSALRVCCCARRSAPKLASARRPIASLASACSRHGSSGGKTRPAWRTGAASGEVAGSQ